jgi:hypothetical protein
VYPETPEGWTEVARRATALVKRLNGMSGSVSLILSLGDETAGGSMAKRLRYAGNSLATAVDI